MINPHFFEGVEMDTAYFYLFSTIPQVLAAFVAVIGIFVLFRYESYQTEILGFGSECLKIVEMQATTIYTKHYRVYQRLEAAIIRRNIEKTMEECKNFADIMKDKMKSKAESSKSHEDYKLVYSVISSNHERQIVLWSSRITIKVVFLKNLLFSGYLCLVSIAMIVVSPLLQLVYLGHLWIILICVGILVVFIYILSQLYDLVHRSL